MPINSPPAQPSSLSLEGNSSAAGTPALLFFLLGKEPHDVADYDLALDAAQRIAETVVREIHQLRAAGTCGPEDAPPDLQAAYLFDTFITAPSSITYAMNDSLYALAIDLADSTEAWVKAHPEAKGPPVWPFTGKSTGWEPSKMQSAKRLVDGLRHWAKWAEEFRNEQSENPGGG